MKKRYIAVLLILLGKVAAAQNLPPYVHSFGNMYLENSAAAGINGYSVLYFSFHRQQLGNIEGAPEHASVSFHTPFRQKQYAFGANISYFRQSIQQTSNAYITFARRLDFGRNQHLQVGISGGFFHNTINAFGLSDAELTDPILASLDRKLMADIRSGAMYQYKNLQLGLALPRLSSYYGTSGEQNVRGGFKPLQNYTLSAAYRFNASPDIIIHPMVLYRQYEYESKAFFEVNTIANYKDLFWVGGAYRQDYGLFFMAGVKTKERMSVGYAYKPANNQLQSYGNPAHELQIGLHFGKRISPTPKTLPTFTQLPGRTIRVTPAKLDTTIRIEIVRQMLAKPTHPLEMAIGNYLIVGSFRFEQNARSFVNTVQKSGYEARLGYNSTKQLYYVYVYVGDNLEEVREQVRQIRAQKAYTKAWIFKVTE